MNQYLGPTFYCKAQIFLWIWNCLKLRNELKLYLGASLECYDCIEGNGGVHDCEQTIDCPDGMDVCTLEWDGKWITILLLKYALSSLFSYWHLFTGVPRNVLNKGCGHSTTQNWFLMQKCVWEIYKCRVKYQWNNQITSKGSTSSDHPFHHQPVPDQCAHHRVTATAWGRLNTG